MTASVDLDTADVFVNGQWLTAYYFLDRAPGFDVEPVIDYFRDEDGREVKLAPRQKADAEMQIMRHLRRLKAEA